MDWNAFHATKYLQSYKMKFFPDLINILMGVFIIIVIVLAIAQINPYYERELKETCEGYYCGTYSNWTCTSRSGEIIDFRVDHIEQPEECRESSCCDWGMRK